MKLEISIPNEIFIIAEIGINHNGSLEIAKKLIDVAKRSGCDAVKFQKRDIETVYSKEELDKLRESPWGKTQREQKLGLEFSEKEYDEIDQYCKKENIEWFASAWDIKSLDFLKSVTWERRLKLRARKKSICNLEQAQMEWVCKVPGQKAG